MVDIYKFRLKFFPPKRLSARVSNTFHGNIFQSDEPILVPLSLIMPLAKDKIGQTVLRLTYRANAYSQMRLATLMLRDVQRSDETRNF